MFIFLFTGKSNKANGFVKPYSGEVSINCKKTESRIIVVFVQKCFDCINQLASNMLSTIVTGYSQSPYLNGGIATELFSCRESLTNLIPLTIGNILATDSVIQQTAICNNLSLILKDECVCPPLLKGTFGIVEKEIIQIVITTVKCSDDIIFCQTYKTHTLQTNLYSLTE